MNRERLAREIADVLELPHRGRQDEAWDIMNAVLKAIIEGLYRGERIRIDGFGTFRIAEHPSVLRRLCFYPYLGKGQHSEIVRLPSKKYVRFEPAKPLLRMLNG